jgi:hypothetical protein
MYAHGSLGRFSVKQLQLLAHRDLLVTPDIFPLSDAFIAARRAFERENEHRRRLATIFNCA